MNECMLSQNSYQVHTELCLSQMRDVRIRTPSSTRGSTVLSLLECRDPKPEAQACRGLCPHPRGEFLLID